MKNLILLASLSLLITSCATILNKKTVRIDVYSDQPALICIDKDSSVSTPVSLEVPRSYNDFDLLIKNDTTQKTIRIKSRIAPEFAWGNLLFYYYSPLAYMADVSGKQKIFAYNNSIKVDLTDSISGFKKWKPSKKGQFYVRGAIPWFNYAEFNNGLSYKNYDIYHGLTAGLDYYHSPKSFLSFSGGITGISEFGIPVMDREYSDTLESAKAFSAMLTNNHNLGVYATDKVDITVGYGLSFTHFDYNKKLYDSAANNFTELFKSNKSVLGLSLNANFTFFKYYFVGFNFLPSIYTLNTGKLEYSELTFIDFGLRIPLGHYSKKLKVVSYKPKLIE